MSSFSQELEWANAEFDDRLDLDISRLLTHPLRRVAVAESITGGGLSERLTRVPGSSGYFVGGIVCYTPAIKLQFCGVSAAILGQFGAVSAQVTSQMAGGIQKLFKADIGLAVTGFAGPDRHQPENTGLVFIGIQVGEQRRVHSFRFQGDRAHIKEKAAQAVLVHLRQTLEAGSEAPYAEYV
jgi:nicotinamide-nucleotide amidase